ncbi:hypothetical protein GOFOIKOB_6153 [Methylobacterium tardum]|uniref:Uncharacterized protein n=1 Tax=Methylobacterium tardum TaxID=374432 RepID=A0AA37THZ2_9HYPH|nr:hypothetical protein [Methylobacterium tardum]URD38759.1 hypothetical protein M6G65_10265 [Methylobacterium tardum]GJE53077.1 hypothetical protein GOFOIKOB_6153 [Methylobacterium tardum]GLS68718.1 hypothetical protein GCM10007890_07300 [Methylobacterium tardum]
MTSPQLRLQDAQAVIGAMEPEEISRALEEAMDKGVSLEELVLRTMAQVRIETPPRRVPQRDDAVWE